LIEKLNAHYDISTPYALNETDEPLVFAARMADEFIVTAPVIVTSSLAGNIPPRIMKCLLLIASLIGLTIREYVALLSEKLCRVIVLTIADEDAPVTNTFVTVFGDGDTCPRISYDCGIN
jgi:hypothetical protein